MCVARSELVVVRVSCAEFGTARPQPDLISSYFLLSSYSCKDFSYPLLLGVIGTSGRRSSGRRSGGRLAMT